MGSITCVTRVCVALLAAPLLAACAMQPPTDAIARDDPFRPYREIETPAYRVGVTPGVMNLKLSAQVDRKTGAVTTMVKVHHHYLGQHRLTYETARNNKAETLKLTVIARYGNCQVRTNCPLDELYTVEIPEPDLRAAAKTGYAYKVFARVGPDVLVTVPPDMITALFGLVDRDRRPGTLATSEPPKQRQP